MLEMKWDIDLRGITCRGLIDGATTLELDNGITKVSLNAFLLSQKN